MQRIENSWCILRFIPAFFFRIKMRQFVCLKRGSLLTFLFCLFLIKTQNQHTKELISARNTYNKDLSFAHAFTVFYLQLINSCL